MNKYLEKIAEQHGLTKEAGVERLGAAAVGFLAGRVGRNVGRMGASVAKVGRGLRDASARRWRGIGESFSRNFRQGMTGEMAPTSRRLSLAQRAEGAPRGATLRTREEQAAHAARVAQNRGVEGYRGTPQDRGNLKKQIRREQKAVSAPTAVEPKQINLKTKKGQKQWEKVQQDSQALLDRNLKGTGKTQDFDQPTVTRKQHGNAITRDTPAKTEGLTEGQKTALKIGGGAVGGALLVSALSKKPKEQTPQTPYY